MARKEFLDYVWKSCIEPQLGYSFSINHTIPYSVIGVQEAHLATHYNPLYWACACLCCNAGNTVQDFEDDEDEGFDQEAEETPQNGSEEPTEASQKKKRAAPNYGKIAKAIADAQLGGVEIGLPDINEAMDDFIPDVKNNRIIYSLRVVNAVSDALYDEIMAKRPFSSLSDFLGRVEGATPAQIIGLIKAGCFDALEKKPRRSILNEYVRFVAEKENPIKDKLTAAHIKKAIQTKMPLEGYKDEVWMFNFKKWIDENQNDPNVKERYLLTDHDAIAFFEKYVRSRLSSDKEEYAYLPNGRIAMKKTAFGKAFDAFTATLKDYFKTEEGRIEFAKHMRNLYAAELLEKECKGDIPQWEMEQMSFYHERHELSNVKESLYGIVDFSNLPETPVMETYTTAKGEKRSSPKTCALAGTIVYVENQRHIVWLLTTHGVVNVKFFSEIFNKYKSVLSKLDPKTGKKTVLDKPWLKRGERILVYGYRREDAFIARSSDVGGRRRILCRINSALQNGTLDLQYSRDENNIGS